MRGILLFVSWRFYDLRIGGIYRQIGKYAVLIVVFDLIYLMKITAMKKTPPSFFCGMLIAILFSFVSAPSAKATCSAQFSHYSGNNPDSIHFYPLVTSSSGYYWTFGDGSAASYLATPWHLYSAPGTYQVCLVVNDSGVYCTWCDSITIPPPPCNAQFNYYALLNNPDSLHFYPTTTSAIGYYWSFGDGNHSYSPTPWHHYANAGIYYVCLTISTAPGVYCSWCDSIFITSNANCNAQFYHYASGNNPDSVHFYPATTNANGYYWSFGDNTTSGQATPWHHYANAGTYYVCLSINVAPGVYCTWCDSVTVTASAPPPCDAHFAYYTLNNPDSVHFYPNSSTASYYYWTFGDGATSTQHYVWHHYAAPGTYYVCLVVNNQGSYCTWCDSVVIPGSNPPPCNTHFSWYTLSNPDSLHFYPTGTGGGAYYWSFGDGTNATQQYPWHFYSSPGTYAVCLTVNNGGNYCTWCDSIHILPYSGCNAQFSFYYLNAYPDSLHFYPTGTPGASCYWSFGDGHTSTQPYPWHQYAAPGTYYVCHVVNNNGTYCTCCDSVIIGTGSSFFQMAPPGGGNNFDFYPVPTGIATTAWNQASAQLSPNPANRALTLQLDHLQRAVSLQLFNANGILVYKQMNMTNGRYEIKTNDLVPGLYFYQLTDQTDFLSTGKISIVH